MFVDMDMTQRCVLGIFYMSWQYESTVIVSRPMYFTHQLTILCFSCTQHLEPYIFLYW